MNIEVPNYDGKAVLKKYIYKCKVDFKFVKSTKF